MAVVKIRNTADDGWITVGGGVEILQQDAEPTSTYPGQLWIDTDGTYDTGWLYLDTVSAGTGNSVTIASGLPSGIVELQVLFKAISHNGTNAHIRFQLGYGATPTWVTTGYYCHAFYTYSSTAGDSEANVAGFPMGAAAIFDPTRSFTGTAVFNRFHPNEDFWICHVHAVENTYTYRLGSDGYRDIANELTAIRVINDASAVFDAGYFSVRYKM